jgi:hypothetical protein
MIDSEWEKVYNSGVLTGSSHERVRILNIIEKLSAEAGTRAIMLRQGAKCFKDESEFSMQRKALAEIAEYEQQRFVKIMKEINDK